MTKTEMGTPNSYRWQDTTTRRTMPDRCDPSTMLGLTVPGLRHLSPRSSIQLCPCVHIPVGN